MSWNAGAVAWFSACCLMTAAPVFAVEPEVSASHGALTSEGSFYVTWASTPDPVPLNEMFELRILVAPASDRAALVSGAVVTANAWMPVHNHGMSLQPEIESRGDGSAIGRGFLLHMPGLWELRVAVMVNGQMERATFAIELEP